MNDIYFSNKGITNKLQIPNLWPSKETNRATREFFAGKDLLLLIDPIHVDKAYYKATFQLFDAATVTFFENHDGNSYMYSYGFMWADLDKGQVTINTRLIGSAPLMHHMTEVEKNRFWAIRDEGLKLLRAGVEEFNRYFPVQEYKK